MAGALLLTVNFHGSTAVVLTVTHEHGVHLSDALGLTASLVGILLLWFHPTLHHRKG